MGLRKRNLYKRERKPARARAWAPTPGTKLTEADLSQYEAELGIAAAGYDHGIIVGRILGYDQRTNAFTVVGKRRMDGKAVEAVLPGPLVSSGVIAARIIANVKRLTRETAR
jgi:hypothetical protein